MPRLNSSNNAETTITVPISPTATSFSVADASVFPNAPFRVSINAEIMEVGTINRTNNTFANVQRGIEGTVAASHSSGTSIQNRFTAGTYSELISQTEFNALETEVDTSVTSLNSELDSHEANKSNPHGVTASQVGAYTKAEIDESYAKVNGGQTIQAGITTLAASNGSNRTVSIEFPTPFTGNPKCFASVANSTSADAFGRIVIGAGRDKMSVTVYATMSATVTIHWMAIGSI